MRGLAIACTMLLAGCVSSAIEEAASVCEQPEEFVQSLAIQTSNSIVSVGCWAVGLGILSLFLGSIVGISRYVSGLVILSGLLVAVCGPALSGFLSSETAHWIMTGVFVFVAIDLIIIISYKSWELLKKVKSK